jgi:hypothetical protein
MSVNNAIECVVSRISPHSALSIELDLAVLPTIANRTNAMVFRISIDFSVIAAPTILARLL